MEKHNKIKVLMIGAGRKVKGGVTSVVNSYYDNGLSSLVDLDYIETMRDGSKLLKLFIALHAYILFCIKVKKYDIVHVHMATDPSFSRKAFFIKKAHRKNKKIIIHQHGGDFQNFYYNLSDEKKRERIRYIFSLADRVIVLTDKWKDFFSNGICNSDRIVVLNNGIRIPEIGTKDYTNKNVLFLGRTEKEKGLFELIEAFRELVKIDRELNLYIAGSGRDFDKVYTICQDDGLLENIHFLGWITNEKADYLNKCSVFILPSYFEALPMSVLEAMGYGLSVIATRVGGLPDVIDDGVNGFLIDKKNSEQIKEKILYLIGNEEIKRNTGLQARKLIQEKYDISVIVNRLYKLYIDLAKVKNDSST